MTFIVITCAFLVAMLFWWKKTKRLSGKKPPQWGTETPLKWIRFLEKKVSFYRNLDTRQRARFEHDLKQFLSEVRITGVDVEITFKDRLLVASSAIIPLFGFPTWHYTFLDEVILYPQSFDRNFQIGNPDEVITGMVGNGPMEGKMILSKPSLHAGFDVDSDKRNVGIHEFVHLFDKEDGMIDGIPPIMEDNASSLPWLELIRNKTQKIVKGRSDIDGYAATNHQEFLAVASEYFFERPHLLKRKHPQLYGTLCEVFNQDLAETEITNDSNPWDGISRNAPCPCGSGQKYKRCCIE